MMVILWLIFAASAICAVGIIACCILSGIIERDTFPTKLGE